MRRKKPETVVEPILPFKYSPRITLHPGDIFRCSGGPYYMSKDGKKIMMGERGLFKYVNLAKNGIIASPYQPRNIDAVGRTVFIYTGEEKVSEATGTHFCSHKIKRVKK
jgi:hypothetical protein